MFVLFVGQVNYIAMWLACIYRSMDDFQDNSTLITELEKMIMIPLSTNVLVSLKDVAVFIMSNSDASAKSSQQKGYHLIHHFYIFSWFS